MNCYEPERTIKPLQPVENQIFRQKKWRFSVTVWMLAGHPGAVCRTPAAVEPADAVAALDAASPLPRVTRSGPPKAGEGYLRAAPDDDVAAAQTAVPPHETVVESRADGQETGQESGTGDKVRDLPGKPEGADDALVTRPKPMELGNRPAPVMLMSAEDRESR